VKGKNQPVRRPHGKQSGDSPSATEAEFAIGYFYRSLEEYLSAFCAQEGCPVTVTDLALRVGRLLQDKAVRQEFRDSELVPEMRQNGARAGLRGSTGTNPAFHVRALGDGTLKRKRVLSAKALKAISNAQKARWAKHHAEQLAAEGAPRRGRPRLTVAQKREHNRLRMQAERARKGVGRGALTPQQRSRGAKALRNYWGMMTPLQRSAEMKRRREVAAEKKKLVSAA
jgi:hypothetical protein